MQLGLGEVTAAEKLAAVWVASEAAFYLVQTAIASQASDRHSPFTGVAQWSPGRRRELWRRLLATQPAAEYLSSWLYREPSFPTPATLLLGWSGVPGFPSPRAAAAAAARSFRGVGWEEITEGDAYEWGARALFAAPSLAALTPAQEEELRALISELEQAAGKALAAGGPTPGVKSMCAQMDRLQWSSRPLLYYALSDGLVQAAYAAPKMRSLGYTRRRTGELGYYYRRGRGAAAEPASSAEARGGERGAPSAADAFVFVHGIGVGPAVYADVLERMVCDDTPVVAVGDATTAGGLAGAGAPLHHPPRCGQVETDAISQKLFPAAALSPDRFAQLLDRALAELGVERAVICGHSYGPSPLLFGPCRSRPPFPSAGELEAGTALVSYALNRDRHRRRPRLCGAVLLDPIATLLHHSTTTREFVYRPASGLADAIADYLFKKELWTSRAVSRSIVFHEASFFLEDCSARRPTLIAVSDDDAIVAPDAIAGRFGTWQSRLAGVQVLRMAGIGHGGWIEDDPAQGDRLVAAVQDLRRQVSNIGRLEGVPRLGAEAVRGVVTPTRGLQRAILRRQRHSRRARKLAPL